MELTYYFIIFLFGLVFGSFLNAFVWRTRVKKTIGGRSMCVHCQKTILAKDLIPILSFLLLRGKCRFCSQKIYLRYPLVEAWVGFSFVFVAVYHKSSFYSFSPEVLRDWFIIFVLTFLFVYDYLYKELPDKITLPSIAIIFVANLLFKWQDLKSMLVGMVVLGGFFLFQFVLSRGAWIGGGDIRLGVLMGAILGWPLSAAALICAYIIGAFISIILLSFKRATLESQTPFGTYLTVATFIIMFWGYDLLNWYLSLLF